MAWQLVGAAIGAIGGIFGASGQSSAQSKARAAQQKAINNQYKYDLKRWDYDWEETQANYRQLVDGINIQRANEESIGVFNDATKLQDYNYRLKIQDYDYNQQVRLYNKSEQLYKQQRGFNELAAQMAYSSENRKLQETFQEAAFNNQDLMVQMLQQEGELMARGVSGRSAGKALQTAVASYGRNQAVLAESLVSAERQTKSNFMNIGLNKYSADLSAESNRMLAPERLPDIPVPFATPRAIFQDPRKPVKPPKPIKGTNTTPGGSALPVITSAISGIAGVTGALSSLYKK
jgi:hypothetical protein